MENPPFDDEFPIGQPGVFRSAPIWLGSIRVSQHGSPKDTERCAKSEKDGPIDLDGSGNLWFHFRCLKDHMNHII